MWYHKEISSTRKKIYQLTLGAKQFLFIIIIVIILVVCCPPASESEYYRNLSMFHTDIDMILNNSNGTYDSAAITAMQTIQAKPYDQRSATDLYNQARLLHLYRDEGRPDLNDRTPAILYRDSLLKLQSLTDDDKPSTVSVLHMTNNAENYLQKFRDMEPNSQLFPEINELQQMIEITRQDTTTNLREIVAEQTADDTRLGKTTAYLEKSKGWESDSQNVHDSSFAKSMQHTIEKLAQKDPQIIPPPGEPSPSYAFRDYLQRGKGNFSSDTKKKALRSLETMEGNQIVHAGMNHNEQQIFNMVWRRSYAKENEKEAENLREMIVNSLSDMSTDVSNPNRPIREFSTVCSSGRIARTVDSLTAVDQDPTFGNSGPQTVDAIRNEIFEFSQQSLQDHIRKASLSSDEKFRNLAESYQNFSTKVDPVTENTFKSLIMKDVKDHIDSTYQENLRTDTRESILTHVEAAL